MFKEEDELLKTAKRIAIRYTYFFQIILLVTLSIIFINQGNLILLTSVHLMGSPLSVSISLNSSINILVTTQLLVLIASQVIFNKDLGGPIQPITSGTAGFRFMDERERLVSDKSIFVTFVYISIFLILWTIIEIFVSSTLSLPLVIITLQFIFYTIAKSIILHKLGWER